MKSTSLKTVDHNAQIHAQIRAAITETYISL